MKCKKCSGEVRVFSPEWQNQREAPVKICPLCCTEVRAVFGASSFAKWFLIAGTVIAIVTFGFSRSAILATLYGLTFGMFVALLPSLELHPIIHSESSARRVLNRSIELPGWLGPNAWLGSLARGIWALGSYLFLLVAVAVGFPPPWGGVLLIFLGAISLVPRVQSSSTTSELPARIGAIGMLVIGVALVFHNYV
jgi:hypothetical protein